jgi:hypothetical protein
MSDLFDSGLLDVKFNEVQGTAYENFPVSPLLIVPQQYTPAIDFNFAATKQLDSRITFTRGSSGTYLDSSGILQTASSNIARFTHDPVTLSSLGLLIEGSSTNLITYSEQINNAAWTHVGGSHTANQTTAPSGEVTADLFTENSAASTQHRMFQIPVVATGTTYTVSVFVKRASGSRQFGLTLTTTTAVARVYFNLDTGTVGTVVAGSGTITAYPNGWYRCTATGVADGLTGTTFLQMCNGTTSGSETYTGDGTSGLYIWGAQLEAGAFATSYILTTTATVNRAADVATMTGTNFSSWYNTAQGSFAWSGIRLANGVAWSINDTTLNNRLHPDGTLKRAYASISSTSESGVFGGGTSAPNNAVFSEAIGYLTQSYYYASSAGDTGSASFVGIPSVTQLQLGNVTNAARYSGTLSRLRYYRVRLPNASLQAITT